MAAQEHNLELRQEIGRRINELRRAHNLTQNDLANRLSDAGRATIQRWENGQSTPSADQLVELFTEFEVEPNAFFRDLTDRLTAAMTKAQSERWFTVRFDEEFGKLQETVSAYEEQCDYTLEAQEQIDTMLMLPDVWKHYYYVVRTALGLSAKDMEEHYQVYEQANEKRRARYLHDRASAAPLPGGELRRFNVIYSSTDLMAFTLGAGIWLGLDPRLREQQLVHLINTIRKSPQMRVQWLPFTTSQFGVFGDKVIVLHEYSYEIIESRAAARIYAEEFRLLSSSSRSFMRNSFSNLAQIPGDESITRDLRTVEEAEALLPPLRCLEYLRLFEKTANKDSKVKALGEELSGLAAPLVGTPIRETKPVRVGV